MNFTYHDIHDILKDIYRKCPDCLDCKKNIPPNFFSIDKVENNNVYFSVFCPYCKNEMLAECTIEKTEYEAASTFNASSKIIHDAVIESPVHCNDIESIPHELANVNGKFNRYFANLM